MNMETFKMLDGYGDEYRTMLDNELGRLVEKKSHGGGITFKEDNMIFQLKTHLGIDVDIVSQRAKTVAKTKDIGIEAYN
jgi:hypothetical protein